MLFANRLKTSKSSIIRDILKLLDKPGLISFAGGMPAPELFPVEELEHICAKILKTQGPQSLQYSISEGLVELRKNLCSFLKHYHHNAKPENFLITSGAQQALDLVGKLFLDKGDTVFIENPCYLGAIQAFNMFEVKYETIPMDEQGMRADILEKKLKYRKPKLIYTVPDFHNPTGRTLSLERRKKIVQLAGQYNVPVVEDTPYSYIRFEGRHLPGLISFDKKGVVVSLGSFSKIVSPGMRLGWIQAHTGIISKFLLFKQASDLHCSTFTQKIVAEYLKSAHIFEHVEKIKHVYKQRRDVMAQCIENYFPKGSTYTKAEGGLFIWAVLPEGIDTNKLLRKAIKNNVAYVPGDAFHVSGGKNTLRMNFSNSAPREIETGMKRLGKLFNDECK